MPNTLFSETEIIEIEEVVGDKKSGWGGGGGQRKRRRVRTPMEICKDTSKKG